MVIAKFNLHLVRSRVIVPARLCLCLGFCPRNQPVGGLPSCSIYGSGYPGDKEKNVYIKETIFIYVQFDCVRLRKTNIRFSRLGPSF